ncbi:MAG TPA: hypothetical protein VGO46_07125 [Gemmatimonadaceae bacterium]|nr:hypothetical protein [Gemmatimonadaceae bacterium]
MHATRERLAYAVAWAAATTPLIMTVGYAVATIRSGDFHVGMIVFACLAAYVIGWPCALVGGALIAFAFGKGVIENNRSASIASVVAATVLGYAGVWMVWTYYDDDMRYLNTMSLAGAIAGLVAGVCFCYLARLDAPRLEG